MNPLLVTGAITAASMLSQAEKEKRDKKLQAAIARWSPWTGMASKEVDYADPLGTAAQGAGSYMAQDQAAEAAKADQKYRDRSLAILEKKYGVPSAQPAPVPGEEVLLEEPVPADEMGGPPLWGAAGYNLGVDTRLDRNAPAPQRRSSWSALAGRKLYG